MDKLGYRNLDNYLNEIRMDIPPTGVEIMGKAILMVLKLRLENQEVYGKDKNYDEIIRTLLKGFIMLDGDIEGLKKDYEFLEEVKQNR